jgi:DHA1 family tetracycline resistance protein-like MFS transporter
MSKVLSSKRSGRAAFAFIFVTVLLDMLSFGLIIPVLPKLIVQFDAGDIAAAATKVGVFGFIFAAMQFLFAPVIGNLSDRFGRRPIVLLSNFGMGCDYILMALAPSLSWLLIGRLISGITSASFPTANAYVSDVTPEDQRAGKLGMLSAAFGVGFIIGPAMGGLLAAHGLRYPFWAAAGLSLVNFCYGAFVLPESLPVERRMKFDWTRANPLGSLRLLRRHPQLFGIAAALFVYFIAHEALPSMFVLYTDYRYQWNEQLTGGSLAIIGVCSAIVSAVLIQKFVAWLGEARTALLGLSFGIVGFGLFGFAPTTGWFLAAFPLISLWGITGSPMQALMSRRVSSSEQGQLQGSIASLFGVAGMIGPLIFTGFFAAAIAKARVTPLPGVPFWFASFLLAVGFAIAWVVTRNKVKVEAAPEIAQPGMESA